MAPFFFFDFTFDKSTPQALMQISRPERKERPTKTDNLCPYRIPTIDEIVKDIESASYRTDKQKFVSDLFECGAIAVSNMVDLSQRKKREERYLQIIRNYKPSERSMLTKIFAKIYALLASVVYDNGKFNDNLGELFMRCDLGNKNTGQFFTPYHISEFMARATLEESLIKEKAEKDDILTISDPCCGGGGLLIAALDVLKSLGVNYARNCFIDCGDIDIRCIHMTYLQLSLAGVPAIVKHQNALTREFWGVWYTPAYLFQYPRFANVSRANKQ